ncbi:MAG: phosphate signaling complex protein PhoU [Actinomycetales bacterium]|nr:phosphate signaling complex protein PhoU [Actinomycetales bacterium]
MRTIFEAELTQLGEDLVAMSRLVEAAMADAGTALLTGDVALAEQVIAADRAVDALEQDLDERCIALLAQQQPVATDLRTVVTALRMSASLERMGDLARHIATVARLRYPTPAAAQPLGETFAAMHDAANRVAQRTTRMLSTHDLDVAEKLERDDDLLDGLLEEVFATVLAPSWEGSAQETVDATLLSRYFERFGDHGVSVARRMVYLVTGETAVPA